MGGKLGYPIPVKLQTIYHANDSFDALMFDSIFWFGTQPFVATIN